MINFEAKKWRKSLKNLLFIFIVSLAVIAFVFMVGKDEKKEKQNHLDQIEQDFGNIENARNMLGSIPVQSKADRNRNDKLYKLYGTASAYLNDHYGYYAENDWKHANVEYRQYLKTLVKIQDLHGQTPNLEDDLHKLISKYDYFIKHQIRPVNLEKSTAALYFTKKVSDIFTSYLGIVIVILLFFDLYAKEYRKQSFKLLKMLPIKKIQINTRKFEFSLIISLLLPIYICLLAFCVGLIFSKKVGHFNYPIFIEGSTVITLGQYLVTTVVTFYAVIFATLLIIYFGSKISRDTFVSLVGTGLLALMPIVFINEFYPQNKIAKFTPFYYTNLFEKSNNLAISKTVFVNWQPFLVGILLTVLLAVIIFKVNFHWNFTLPKRSTVTVSAIILGVAGLGFIIRFYQLNRVSTDYGTIKQPKKVTRKSPIDKRIKAFNAEVAERIKIDQGFAAGKLDDDGKPSKKAQPDPVFKVVNYIDSIKLTKDDYFVATLKPKFRKLSEKEKNGVIDAVENLTWGTSTVLFDQQEEDFKKDNYIIYQVEGKIIGKATMARGFEKTNN
ncbi:ABC transporter permease [Xylocopilactobacillus apis]|uniref:ABC transporter permease n=1 Tax=Xylocopilactobacillus apis TaxID=2932183 RepID=A0AAU9D4D1_9LACO|nr:ABC transporter permease subunit [Xylocopilactobacillus apis]BDR55682.1 hypothetical protein KIMC2_02440 [Xylocopilactobacillus apis]